MHQLSLPPKRNHRIKTTVSQFHTTTKYERYHLVAEYKAAKNKLLRALSTGKSTTQKQLMADSMRSTSMAKKQQLMMFRSFPSTNSNYVVTILLVSSISWIEAIMKISSRSYCFREATGLATKTDLWQMHTSFGDL